jgi:hypothetical protein
MQKLLLDAIHAVYVYVDTFMRSEQKGRITTIGSLEYIIILELTVCYIGTGKKGRGLNWDSMKPFFFIISVYSLDSGGEDG